jgi:hypothetical protein
MTRDVMDAHRKGQRRTNRTVLATLPVDALADVLWDDMGMYGGNR